MATIKTKVVHVIDSLRASGAETLLVNTIIELKEFDHVVVALNGPEDLRDLLPGRVTYYRLKFVFGKLNFFSTIIKLKKIIKAEKPDIIHAHLYWSIIQARLARRKTPKFIFTLHGMVGTRLFKKRLLYRILERLTITRSQHMVAVSKTVYDDYFRYIPFKGKGHIIYNYVPDEFFINKKEDFASGETLRIVTVGSLRDIKNHKTIIKAIALAEQGYSLDIYGYGELEKELKQLAADNNADVTFKGNVKEVYKVLPAYDLFVMASITEGHSIALLEAMALKMPVVLSDIPSFRETTMDKGLFFKTEDEKELAEKLRMIKESEALRKSIADQCHEVIKSEATKEKYLSNIRALYNKE